MGWYFGATLETNAPSLKTSSGKTTFFFWPSKDKLVFLWSNTRCGAGLRLSTILYKKYISLNSRIILSSGSSHREALAGAETLRAEQSPISLASLTSVRDSRAEALKGLKWPFKNPPAPLSWPRNLSLNFFFKSASVHEMSLLYSVAPPLFPVTSGS